MPALTAADNNKVVNVAVGDAVNITLDGNPTTGYTWSRAGYEKAASASDDNIDVTSEYRAAQTGMMGSGGAYHITIKAKKAGEHKVELVYSRTFEAPSDKNEKYTVTLHAQ